MNNSNKKSPPAFTGKRSKNNKHIKINRMKNTIFLLKESDSN